MYVLFLLILPILPLLPILPPSIICWLWTMSPTKLWLQLPSLPGHGYCYKLGEQENTFLKHITLQIIAKLSPASQSAQFIELIWS